MVTRVGDFAPGPWPVIHAICQECGLVEVVDDIVEWDQEQADISPGLLTAGLVMNFLTEGEPMYRLSDFFENKDPENLFGDDISSEDLYDQRFGWALDTISDAGPRQVLNSVIAKAITTEDVDIGVVHADTTSKSVHGEYEQDREEEGLNIAKGYSRDGNRQLKQFNIGLGVTHRGVPRCAPSPTGTTHGRLTRETATQRAYYSRGASLSGLAPSSSRHDSHSGSP